MNMQRYDEALALFEQVIEMGRQKGDPSVVAHALNKMGVLEERRGKYHKALLHWQRAHDHLDQLSLPEPLIESQVLMNLGTFHYLVEDYDEALRYFMLAYDNFAKINNTEAWPMSISISDKVFMEVGITRRRLNFPIRSSPFRVLEKISKIPST